MGWKAGSFYRIKNKEEENRKYLIGWVIQSTLFGMRRNKDPSIESSLGLAVGDYLLFWPGRAFKGTRKFGLLALYSGQWSLYLGPKNLFQHLP